MSSRSKRPRKSASQIKVISAWLDATEAPADHEVAYIIAALEAEQRADEALTSTMGTFAAVGLALVAVGFTMGATVLAVCTLLPVTSALSLAVWHMVTTRKRLDLLIRLYGLRHRPPRPKGRNCCRR